jgi:hypothetical protein
MIISRNKKKERETFNNKGVADNSIPDAALLVVKQRHGDFEGVIPLWFERHSQQFVEVAFEPAKVYL